MKAILIFIGIGIWILVLQNAGIIPTSQNVNVTNEVSAYVRGRVNVDGGSVSIDNRVQVQGIVDVNLEKVLGHPVGAHDSYTIDGKKFCAIDVHVSN